MEPSTHQTDRERQARLEAGVTDVHPGVARTLVATFITLIVAVPAIQQFGAAFGRPSAAAADLASACRPSVALSEAWSAFTTDQGSFIAEIVAANRAVLASLRSCEDHLEDRSVLGRTIRPSVQATLARSLGMGNEQVYLGRDGWLFYRPDVDLVAGPGFLDAAQLSRRVTAALEWRSPPQPDPRPAIFDFHDQLARRGVELIVVPTPVKPTIHPERLAASSRGSAPLQNRSYRRFVDELEAAGVIVFDPADVLVDALSSDPTPTYLATDTHWRPDAMQRVAAELAALVRRRLGWTEGPPAKDSRASMRVRAQGDLLAMLDVPMGGGRFALDEVDIHPVDDVILPSPGPGDAAGVLLLGDSFSNIYSLEAMGWGTGAGFADQLAFELQRPVDRIVRNDNGAFATREALARELAQGPDRLRGTRVLVYQFATRELAFGDWKLIDLPAAPAPIVDGFLALSSGRSVEITGVIADASAVPRPDSVPYRDHVRSLHLVDVRGADDSPLGASDALVYVQSMRDSEWTSAATWRPGQRVALRLRAWEDVSSAYDGLNRSELSDDRLLLVAPVWGDPRDE